MPGIRGKDGRVSPNWSRETLDPHGRTPSGALEKRAGAGGQIVSKGTALWFALLVMGYSPSSGAQEVGVRNSAASPFADEVDLNALAARFSYVASCSAACRTAYSREAAARWACRRACREGGWSLQEPALADAPEEARAVRPTRRAQIDAAFEGSS
jgi:hypothetical protein